MADPVKLQEIRAKPVTALIELLEGLLEDAKNGKMQGCSVAWVDRDTNILTAFGGDRLYSQLGALEILKARMIDYVRDR